MYVRIYKLKYIYAYLSPASVAAGLSPNSKRATLNRVSVAANHTYTEKIYMFIYTISLYI